VPFGGWRRRKLKIPGKAIEISSWQIHTISLCYEIAEKATIDQVTCSIT